MLAFIFVVSTSCILAALIIGFQAWLSFTGGKPPKDLPLNTEEAIVSLEMMMALEDEASIQALEYSREFWKKMGDDIDQIVAERDKILAERDKILAGRSDGNDIK